MKRIFIIIMIFALAALLVYRFIERRETRAALTIQQIQAKEGFPVELEISAVRHFQMENRYTGVVTGGEEAEVVSMLGEYISDVFVNEGQMVKVGQAICRLSRENPSANYAQAKLLYENADRDRKRLETLFQQGAISRQSLDNGALASELAKERFASVERLLTISSPISGAVTDLEAEVGKFAQPGISLARIVSTGELRIRVEIPSSDRKSVQNGAKAFVEVSGARIPAIVNRIAHSAERESRTFTAWIEIGEIEKNFALSSGLMVDVALVAADVPEAVTVTDDAVLRFGNDRWIFVIDGDRAIRRSVIVGGESDGLTWISSGLDAGTRVVAVGANNLQHGAKVRVISKS